MSTAWKRHKTPYVKMNRNSSVRPEDHLNFSPPKQFSLREFGYGPESCETFNAPDEITAVMMFATKLRNQSPYPDRTLIILRKKNIGGHWVVSDNSSPRFIGVK